MKKFVNVRIFVLFAVFLIYGILCGYSALKGYAWVVWVVVGISILFGFLLLIFKKYKIALLTLYCVLCLFGGFINFNLNSKPYISDDYQEKNLSISGRLTDFYALYDNYMFVTVRDCMFSDGSNVDYLKDGRVGAYIYFDKDITPDLFKNSVGYYIDFDCKLSDVNVFIDGINTYYIKNNINYIAKNISNITLSKGNSKFDETARKYIKDIIYENMSSDTASVGIALLLGDKSGMSLEIKNGYRAMGVAHIFAVSGLHIGFIYSFLAFFIRKIKISRWKALPIIFLPMLFYAWICGFSPSVVRALIMTTCLLLSSSIGVKNDRLSAVAVAAIIILMIQPLYFFDAGFLMSFGAVLGIVILSPIITKKIKHRKPVTKFVFSAFLISFSAFLGVSGIIANFYGELSLLGLIFNIVMTPVIACCFIVLLLGLLPYCSFLLFVPQTAFSATNAVARFLTANGIGNLPVKSFWLGTVLIFLCLFIAGGYFNLKKSKKIIAVAIVSLLIVSLGIYAVIPKKTIVGAKCFASTEERCFVMTNKSRCAYIVCDFRRATSASDIANYCIDNDIEEAYIFILDNDYIQVENLELLKQFGIKISKIYTANSKIEQDICSQTEAMNIQFEVLSSNNRLNFENLQVTCIKDGLLFGWFFNINDIGFLFSNASTTDEFCRIYECSPKFSEVVFINSEEAFVADFTECSAVITQNRGDGEKIFGTKEYGDFTLTVKDDKIFVLP